MLLVRGSQGCFWSVDIFFFKRDQTGPDRLTGPGDVFMATSSASPFKICPRGSPKVV